MKIISAFLSVTVLVTALLTGCKGKDGDPGPAGANGTNGPAGPSGQNLTGSIVGFVSALDESGQPLSKAGVLVTLANVSPQLTQTTDANGRYEFTNMRGGTYNLTYSRADLGTYKVFGFGHTGGDQPSVVPGIYYGNSIPLVGISTASILSFSAGPPATNSTGTYYVPIQATFGPGSNYFSQFVLFASTTPAVNSSNGTLLQPSSYSGGSSGITTVRLSQAQLNGAGFPRGTRVYLIAYALTGFYANYSYTEVSTGRLVFPSMNPNASSVISVLVP